MKLKHQQGFTLAELLISLAVLGVIAAFTIPKIIGSQQNKSFESSAKEDIATMSAALQIYKSKNNFDTATFQLNNLEQYINYVRIDSTSTVDLAEGYTGTVDCSSGYRCLRMHNGSVLYWTVQPAAFNPIASFFIDPDGVALNASSTTGQSKSIGLFFTAEGRPYSVPINTPVWFQW